MINYSALLFRQIIPTIFLIISFFILFFVLIHSNTSELFKKISIILLLACVIALIFYFWHGFDKGSDTCNQGKLELVKIISQRWGSFIVSFSIVCASLIVGIITMFNEQITLPYNLDKILVMWVILAVMFMIFSLISRWYGGMVQFEKLLNC